MQHEDLFPDEFPLEELLRLDDDPDNLTESELLPLEPVPDEDGESPEQDLLFDEPAQILAETENSAEEPETESPAMTSGPVYEDVPVSAPRFFGDIPLGPDDGPIEDPEDDDDFELFSGVSGKLSDFRAPRREEIPEPDVPLPEPEQEPESEPLMEAEANPDDEDEPLPLLPQKPFTSPGREEPAAEFETEYAMERPVPSRRSVFDIPMWDEDTPDEDPEDDDFELFSGIAGGLNDFGMPQREPAQESDDSAFEQESATPEIMPEPEEEPEEILDDGPEYQPLPISQTESVAPVTPEETEMPEAAPETEPTYKRPASAGRSFFDIPIWDEDTAAEDLDDDDDFELFSGIAGSLNDFRAPRQETVPENAEQEPVSPEEPEYELQEPEIEPQVINDEPAERTEEISDDEPEYEPLPIAPPDLFIPDIPEEPETSEPEPEPVSEQTAPAKRSFFDIPMWEDNAAAENPADDDDFELFSGITGNLNDFRASQQVPIPESVEQESGIGSAETENGPEAEPEEVFDDEAEDELLPIVPSLHDESSVQGPEEKAEKPVNIFEQQSDEHPDQEQDDESENSDESEPEDEFEDEEELEDELESEPEVKQPRLLGWFFRKKPGQKAESIVVEEAEEPQEVSPEVPVPPDYKAPAPIIIHSVPLDEEPEDDGSPITLMPDIEGSISDFIAHKEEELLDFSDGESPEEESSESTGDENPEDSPEKEQASNETDTDSGEDSDEESDEEEKSGEKSDESGEESDEENTEEDDGKTQQKSLGLFARLKKGRQKIFGNDSRDEEDESKSGDESEEEEEEQGLLQKAPLADIPPRQLASIYGAGLRLMRVRVLAALLLCLPLIYLNLADSLNLPIYLVMWDDSFACLTMLELLAIILVLNFDTMLNGLLDPFRGKASLASVPIYAALFTMADCAVFALIGREGPFPCAGAAGLAVAMTGLGHYYHRVGDRSSCRAAGNSSTPERISRQKEDGEITDVLLKCGGGSRQFGSQIQESDGIRELIGAVGLIILLAGIALAGVSILNGGNEMSFFWFASVILTAASPLAATLAYGMPYRRIAARLAQGGAAIAGWKGVVELNAAKEMVLNDSDFFPSGMVKCTTIRTRGEIPAEEILGYAATLIHMGGCGVDSTFAEQVYTRGAAYHFEELTDFCIYEDGGYGGRFGDKEIAVGTAELMESLEIPFSRKQASRTALFCAVNGELAAIFNLNYTLPAYVLSSMKEMERAKLKGILATRDFNLSPENLKKVYGIPLNKLRIAEIDERIDLTPDDSPAGTDLGEQLCREGIDTHVDTVIGAKRLYRSARKSARWLSASSVVGMALGAYLTIMHAYTALEPINLLIFLILWSLPPIIQGTQADKY